MEAKISIPRISVQTMNIKIRGTSSLICNRFSDTARGKILDKQMQKASKGREAKDPEKLFKESLYPVPGKKDNYGFPSTGFKKAMVEACRNVEGFPMTKAKGAFFVTGDIIPIVAKEIKMREDIVRLGTARSKPADVRFRGEFVDWTATIQIKYNEDVISSEQVANLLNIAGFAVGVGDWRPQNNGSHGMFEVVGT